MKRLMLLLALAAAAGCATSDGSVPYAVHLEQIHERIAALETESLAHAGVIDEMTSTDKMAGVEADHHAYCTTFRSDMHARMDAAMRCRDGMGLPPDDMGMSGILGELEDETLFHLQTMWGCDGGDCAHREEDRHQGRMHDFVGRMHDQAMFMGSDMPMGMGSCEDEPPAPCGSGG